MNREEKSQAVAELSDRLKEADAVFAVDYRGISVTQADDGGIEDARPVAADAAVARP